MVESVACLENWRYAGYFFTAFNLIALAFSLSAWGRQSIKKALSNVYETLVGWLRLCHT